MLEMVPGMSQDSSSAVSALLDRSKKMYSLFDRICRAKDRTVREATSEWFGLSVPATGWSVAS